MAPRRGDGAVGESSVSPSMATRRENLGVENGAAGGEWTLSSFLPSMAMSREGPAAEDDVVGGSSNQCINGNGTDLSLSLFFFKRKNLFLYTAVI